MDVTSVTSPCSHSPIYVADHGEYLMQLIQLGPMDAAQLTDWSDAVLHRDYFFRHGHWRGLLTNPDVQVFAITLATSGRPDARMLAGVAITRHHSTLHNLFVDPAWRSMRLGTAVLEILSPEQIRAKTDMSAGDPTNWYTARGYRILQRSQGRNGNITVLVREMPNNFPP